MSRTALALAGAATTLLAAGGPAGAVAAPPQLLGQTATASVAGGCMGCTLVQFAGSSANFSYVVPSSGVLTRVRVYVGADVGPADSAQVRTFRTSGAPNATVISAGQEHRLADTAAAGIQTFFDRVPATAGDVLGARFHVDNAPAATPVEFGTSSGADSAGLVLPPANPGVGASFSVTPAAQQRVNMLATLESDADGDGYGDTSQDLCPADGAVAVTACSGTLFGSRLQGPHTTSGGACGYACLRVQKTVAGASTAAPIDGVVVRWRVLAAATGSYRVRVLAPVGGTAYTVLRSSTAETVTADPSPLKQAISTFPTRLPIPAGSYVALAPPPFAARSVASVDGSTYGQLNDADDGMVTFQSAPTAGELRYDADIEPDADRDGYGDVTQDACPADATTQGACPPPPPPAGPSPTPLPVPPGGGPTTPAISGFAATHARFRVKRRGAVVARRRPHAGTRLRLRLSEAAGVAFTMKRRFAGRWATVHRFGRSLPAGPSALGYSGRYRRGGKVRRLRPGTYRLTAVATNASGRASAASRIRLTVRP